MKSSQTVRGILAFFAILAIISFSGAALARPQSAADSHSAHQRLLIGRKGTLHFTAPVKVGEVTLKPGMYQVQHLEEAGEHVVVFHEMTMPAGYRMSNTPVGREVARVKCKIEPLSKKANRTVVTLSKSSDGQYRVAELEVAGEAFKHLL